MNDTHTCIGCGRAITWKFAICADCERVYGRTSSEWRAQGHGWLAFLWAYQMRERRRDKNILQYEISEADLGAPYAAALFGGERGQDPHE